MTYTAHIAEIDLVQIGDRWYDPTASGRPGCGCRRCAPWKEDFGGCIVQAWAEELICFLAQIPGPFSNFQAYLEHTLPLYQY